MTGRGQKKRPGGDGGDEPPKKQPRKSKKPPKKDQSDSESEVEAPKQPKTKLTASDYPNKVAGGFLKPPPKPRTQKVSWTPVNDRKLLILGLERVFSGKEYQLIADSGYFPENPTAKSIQERLQKLRTEQKRQLDRCGLPQNTNETELTKPAEEEEDEGPADPPEPRQRTGLDAFRSGAPLHVLNEAYKSSQRAAAEKEDDEEDGDGEDEE